MTTENSVIFSVNIIVHVNVQINKLLTDFNKILFMEVLSKNLKCPFVDIRNNYSKKNVWIKIIEETELTTKVVWFDPLFLDCVRSQINKKKLDTVNNAVFP